MQCVTCVVYVTCVMCVMYARCVMRAMCCVCDVNNVCDVCSLCRVVRYACSVRVWFAVCSSGGQIASAEYFSFRKEKRITRNYAKMISVFWFDAAQGSQFCNAG